MKKTLFICATLLFSLFLVAQFAGAQQKITGPWLWVTAPTPGQCGKAGVDVDWLDKASNGAVTEGKVAKNGAKKGDRVGNLKWTEGEISATGGNNINDIVTKIGLGAGDVDNTAAYALITIKSDKVQNNVTMKVGSDDAIKVWLNGEVVWKNAVNRGASGFLDTFKVNLKKGNNLLLIKVLECGGGWAMFAGIQATFTAAGKKYEPTPEPGDKITGPWLWMNAPTTGGKCGASATKTDWLAEASGGKVTEEKIAKKGAEEGDKVGNLKWTKGEISPTGDNNINDLMTRIGLGAGDMDNIVAYGYINVISPKGQDTSMWVGSDDAIKVWLNGKVVWENPVNRGASDYKEYFPVTLKTGSNPLLVAVYECGGGWSGFFGFAAGVNLKFDTKPGQYSVEPTNKLPETWGNIKRFK